MDLKEQIPFRTFHLVAIFEAYEKQNSPLDAFVNHYFREHTSIGSKDRKAIAERVFHLIRWQGLLDHFCEKPVTWKKRVICADQIHPLSSIDDVSIPPYVRVSFPKLYWDQLKESYSEEKAKEICLISNTQAPTAIRVNSLKASRDALFDKWKSLYAIEKSPTLANAIIFQERINFFELEEFKQGFFEVQDEGSQEIAELVEAKQGNHVLDFCSGSGGKSLAIAPKMHNKGVLYLHDIRPSTLVQAKKRLKRAGIQHAQLISPEKLNTLKHKMDWILLDVPCSGSGTLRRNPDLKWKFTPDTIKNLIADQRRIFERAFAFLKEEGKIVYATCSVFAEENEKQIAYFLQNYPVVLEKEPLCWTPQKAGKDGFFGAVLKKK